MAHPHPHGGMGRSITDQLAEAQPRWSTDRKHSPNIPVYVPPEMFRVGKGQGMEIFMLRAQFADMQRISDNKKEDEWYARKRRREDAPVYNAKGERVNTPQNVFKKKRTQVLDELLKWSNRVNDMDAAKTETGPTKKIYFTKEQMQAKTFAAILGARGKTHQELQQSTGCRITLMGRGISDQLKIKGPTEHRAGDDDAPHCHITAPDEESLARCVERVEFIMSDKREAVEFRNEKRKELAILNGTYREETWNKNNPVPGQPGFTPMATAPQRNASSADSEYARFVSELEGKTSAAPPPPPGVPPPAPRQAGAGTAPPPPATPPPYGAPPPYPAGGFAGVPPAAAPAADTPPPPPGTPPPANAAPPLPAQ